MELSPNKLGFHSRTSSQAKPFTEKIYKLSPQNDLTGREINASQFLVEVIDTNSKNPRSSFNESMEELKTKINL